MTGMPEDHDDPCTAMVTIKADLPNKIPPRWYESFVVPTGYPAKDRT